MKQKYKISAKMTILDWIAIIFVIVGGINWGLTSNLVFDFNLVEWLFGDAFFANFVYLLVGISSIFSAVRLIFFRRK